MDADTENLKRLVGHRVKLAREKLGMTQEEFSEKLDRSVPAISNLERGVSLPPLDLLLKISALADCDLAEFVALSPNAERPTVTRTALELIGLLERIAPADQDLLLSVARLLRSRSAH